MVVSLPVPAALGYRVTYKPKLPTAALAQSLPTPMSILAVWTARMAEIELEPENEEEEEEEDVLHTATRAVA